MNDEELKKLLNDPKKLLEFISLAHRLIHVYEAQEMKKRVVDEKMGTDEKMGLNDSLNIQLNHQEVNK